MRAPALWLLAAGLAACYAPSIPDNTYKCTDSASTCPEGMVCNSCRSCVHAGSPIDVGPCLSCGRLTQCYIDRNCQIGDTACAVGCLSKGSAKAQQLAQAVLDCVTRVCTPRCGVPSLPTCTTCVDSAPRGPGSTLGLCQNPADPACSKCLTEYIACVEDNSGN